MLVGYFLLIIGVIAFGDACQCGDSDCLITTVPTIFESPNYPSNYGNLEDCTLTITPPGDKCVQLTYLQFELEEGFDFLQVYGDEQLLFDKSGELRCNAAPSTYSSLSEVTLQFTSDSSYTRAGFQVSIDFVDCPISLTYPTCACDSGCGTITESRTVTSPNFPDEYPNNAVCSFVVQPPEDQCYRVEFGSFATEEDYDFLTVYDESGENIIHEIHGDQNDFHFFHQDRNLLFEFTSDSSVTKRGFEINIIMTTDCNSLETVVHNCDPVEHITSGPTLVTSDGHPFDHSNFINCSVYITPPTGMRAELDFDEINLEVGYDYLYIYENDVEVAEINGRYCDYPTYVGAVDAPIRTHFDSDYSVINIGFRYTVYFTYVGCPTGFTEHIPGICYKIVQDVNVNQADAKAACETTYGAKLFYYESVEEFTTIRKMIKNSSVFNAQPRFWMGLVRENTSSTYWTWGMNGDVMAAADIVFGKGEPNNKAGNEVCMNLLKQRRYKLNDANCDKLGGYVCKVNLA